MAGRLFSNNVLEDWTSISVMRDSYRFNADEVRALNGRQGAGDKGDRSITGLDK
jgi:hypothetical protein